jgi:CDP-diacylglycerol---glycerol-3-phosphate 3-phosphatidyltransferase
MLSARPYIHSLSAAYAEQRLRGTVWQRLAPAHALYRTLMAVGAALGRAGVSANALTYGALALAVATAVAAAQGALGWSALLLLASGALDVLDGAVARATGSASRFGALLDSTVDRLADGLPLAGLAVFAAREAEAAAAVPALALLASVSVSYVRARAEALGAALPPLFMRRAERVILVIASLLVGLVSVSLMLLLLGVVAALGFAATAAALRAARAVLEARPSPPDRATTSE